MGKTVDAIKGMTGILVMTPLAGAAISSIGSNLASFGSGIGGATQTLVAGGVLGHAAGFAKSLWK